MPLAFFFLGLLSLWPSLQADFIADDFGIIHALNQDGFSVIAAKIPLHWFRPVTLTSFWIEHAIWGLNPLPFHLTNLLLHTMVSLSVVLLAYRLLTGTLEEELHVRYVSLFCGIFFLLHPSHSESVCWIAGRGDLLAVLFSILAILLSMDSLQASQSRLQLGACALLALGLLSKEAVLPTPLIMILCSFFMLWKSGTDPWVSMKRVMPWGGLYLAITLALILLRAWRLGDPVAGYGTQVHFNILNFEALHQAARMLLRSLFPPLPASWSVPLSGRIAFLFLGISLGWGWAALSRLGKSENNPFRVGALILSLCLLLTMIPALGVWTPLHYIRGERFIYYPSVFTTLLVGWFGSRYWKRLPRVATFAVFFCIFIFAITLYHSATMWRKAGRVSRQVIQDILEQNSGQELILLNAPECIDHVYVCWNSLHKALALYDPRLVPESILVLSLQWMSGNHLHCSVILEQEDKHEEGSERESGLVLRLFSPNGRLVPGYQGPNIAEFHASDRVKLGTQVTGDDTEVFLWTGGRMWRLGLWSDVLDRLSKKGWLGGPELETHLGETRSIKFERALCAGKDLLAGGNVVPVDPELPPTFLEIHGYAIDREAGRPARDVFLCLNDRIHFLAEHGLKRMDVVRVLKDMNLLHCGFVARCEVSHLPPGEYSLILKGIAADGSGYYSREIQTPLILGVPKNEPTAGHRNDAEPS